MFHFEAKFYGGIGFVNCRASERSGLVIVDTLLKLGRTLLFDLKRGDLDSDKTVSFKHAPYGSGLTSQ